MECPVLWLVVLDGLTQVLQYLPRRLGQLLVVGEYRRVLEPPGLMARACRSAAQQIGKDSEAEYPLAQEIIELRTGDDKRNGAKRDG